MAPPPDVPPVMPPPLPPVALVAPPRGEPPLLEPPCVAPPVFPPEPPSASLGAVSSSDPHATKKITAHPTRPSHGLLERRIRHLDSRVLVHRDPRIGVPTSARVVPNHRILYHDVAGVVVRHEKDRRAVLDDRVVFDERAAQTQGHRGAVVVDGAAAAAARRPFVRRVRAVPDGAIVRKEAVD